MSTKQFQIGDIVTSYRRKQGVIYKVIDIEYQIWTAQQAQWNQCSLADVGKQYVTRYKVTSIFDFDSGLQQTAKVRKITFTEYPYVFTKVEPQNIVDIINKLNHFVVDTWP